MPYGAPSERCRRPHACTQPYRRIFASSHFWFISVIVLGMCLVFGMFVFSGARFSCSPSPAIIIQPLGDSSPPGPCSVHPLSSGTVSRIPPCALIEVLGGEGAFAFGTIGDSFYALPSGGEVGDSLFVFSFGYALE